MKKLLLLLAALLALNASCNAVEVAANNQTNLAKEISINDIRELFLMKKSYYDNGVKVQIFIYSKDNATTRSFLLNTLGISPSAYFDKLDSFAATGKNNLPITVDSDTRMVIKIALNKGGIGIIKDSAYAANINNIRVLEIKLESN